MIKQEPTFDGLELRKLIEARGLSIAGFARLVPVARETASNWCSNKHVPDVESAGLIAQALSLAPVVGGSCVPVTVGELVGLP